LNAWTLGILLLTCVAAINEHALVASSPISAPANWSNNNSHNSTAGSNDGGGDSVPQWETAVFALVGCFGAIGCMLGLKCCTKVYGRTRRACCVSRDNNEDDTTDDSAVVFVNSSGTRKSKKGRGKEGKKGKADITDGDDW
jgi:hypothetical protein